MSNDAVSLNKWNWAAFYFGPLWAVAHKLYLLTVLCFIPFLTFFILIYLGIYGNKLAYPKSTFNSVSAFMAVQAYWNIWAIRFMILTLVIIILQLLINWLY